MSNKLFDLHVHTKASYDSLLSLERAINMAEKRGLDGIAITDHNSFKSARNINKISTDLTIIKGMEVRTRDYDDLIGLFLTEAVQSRQFLNAVDEIHDQGGIAVLPHPFRKIKYIPSKIINSVDAIEVLNSRSKEKSNKKARKFAKDYGKPMTGGSDAHISLEIGQGTTNFSLDSISIEPELKQCVTKGNISWEGTETPYYPMHGISFTIENIKKIL